MGWRIGNVIVIVNGKGRVVLDQGIGCKTEMGNDANGEYKILDSWLVVTGR